MIFIARSIYDLPVYEAHVHWLLACDEVNPEQHERFVHHVCFMRLNVHGAPIEGGEEVHSVGRQAAGRALATVRLQMTQLLSSFLCEGREARRAKDRENRTCSEVHSINFDALGEVDLKRV